MQINKEVESDCYTNVVELRYIQTITHNHNHKKESSTRDDTRLFTKVHLLPGKLVLIVEIHPLDASRATWQSKAKPLAGAAHPLIG
jgi:hypothetical protein